MKLRPLKYHAQALPRLKPQAPLANAMSEMITRISKRRQAELGAPLIRPGQTQTTRTK